MAAKYPTVVKEVRGVGMMLAVEFYSDEIGYEFSKEMYNHKVIIAGTLNNAETIRFEPPGVLTEEEIATVIHGALLKAGDAVLLLRSGDGQTYYVIERLVKAYYEPPVPTD